MAQTSLSRLFSTFTSSSPSSSVSSTIHSNEEEGNDISTERDNFHGRSRILTAVAAEPLGSAAVVTPCRPPNPEKMASSSTTVATAAITPMTPSPFASPFKSPFKLSPSPACSEDSSLEDSVSSQPCVAPTAAPVPNRRLYETGVTFRDLQQGFMGNSSSPPQHESHCRQTPQSADADVLLVESKRRNLFSSERFSETPPRTHQSGSSSSRRHQRAAETYGPTVRSRTSVPASVRKSRLQESLFLIDDPPPSRVGVRSQSANSFSRQPYPSCSYELSSHSSPESSPVSTGSTEAARNSSSSSSLRLLRRRASHASMLVLPHDDDEDSCFEDKKTSNSSRDFLLPKRGSLLVIWTFCMAAAMAAFGMIVVSKFVPFQEAQNAEPSQGLALYSPPVPQRRADLHRSASGLRGKMVQSGASRIVAEEVPPKGAVITTRTSQLNGKPSTTVTNTIVERKVQPQSKKTISTTPKTTQKATKKNRHDKEKKPSLLAKVSKSFSSTSSKASVGANTQSLLLQLAQPRSAPAFQTPERGILSVSLQGWDDLDASLYTSAGKETISLFNKHEGWSPLPRVIALGASFSGMEHRLVKQYPADFSDNTQLYSLLESNDERLSRMERKEPLSDGECVPMHEWQTTFHPLCNGMHELSIEHSLGNESEDEGNNINLFGTKGFWRNAWKLDIEHGSSKHAERDTVVLKTLK